MTLPGERPRWGDLLRRPDGSRDRRLTPANGRVADVALRGEVEAERFVSPEPRRVRGFSAFLHASPGGPRDRELLGGDGFAVLEEREGWAFGQAEKDGYCGWAPAGALGPDFVTTHAVGLRHTQLYPEPNIKAPPLGRLPLGASVAVCGAGAAGEGQPRIEPRAAAAASGDAAAGETRLRVEPGASGGSGAAVESRTAGRAGQGSCAAAGSADRREVAGGAGRRPSDVAGGVGPGWSETGAGWLRTDHLRPVGVTCRDPVEVAERFLGTPYLWAGNTGDGIDCSGLVQVACLACGIACPGDSDLQARALGEPLGADAPLRRLDLLFWKGHVAMVADAGRFLHASGHHMAVVYEEIDVTLKRIAARPEGAPVARRRLTPPRG